ncbi:helix-turn-helix transcriptional regulator [Mesorhizobium sp. ORS 3428]|uniref:helix-turn-helix transcriptional regulator n=1 Tax=Mesorhizobium sp. ORS 3428 TaxID=540997 RepID=UPI003FCD1FCA
MAAQAGDARTPENPTSRTHFLTAPMVADRYSITPMTVWRWLQSNKIGFPKPIYIGKRRYWLESELFEWERSRRENAGPSQRSEW